MLRSAVHLLVIHCRKYIGRADSILQRLFVGASLRPPGHTSTIESLIPNSQVIINPPSLHHPDQIEQSPPVKARSQEWRSELFLHPGDWIPSVAAAVIGTVLLLGMVVFGLNEREKVRNRLMSFPWLSLTRSFAVRRRRTRKSVGGRCMPSISRRYSMHLHIICRPRRRRHEHLRQIIQAQLETRLADPARESCCTNPAAQDSLR